MPYRLLLVLFAAGCSQKDAPEAPAASDAGIGVAQAGQQVTDGRAAIRADRNRGSGSWTADGAGLAVGPLAMTRAMCPPASLHDAFIAQLDYVRSFELEDGKLYLATMVDGSILQFEPLAE